MTPKEKAEQLVDKFTQTIFESGNTVSKPMVKQCALVSIDLMFAELNLPRLFREYWRSVYTEIEKL